MQNWISRSLHHTGFDCNAISLRAPYFECVHQIPLVCIAFKFCELCAFKREEKVFLQVVTFLLSPADFPLVPDFSQWLLNTSKSVQIYVLSFLNNLFSMIQSFHVQPKRIAVVVKMDILDVSLCLCVVSFKQCVCLCCACVLCIVRSVCMCFACVCVCLCMHVFAVLVYYETHCM